MIPVKKGQLVVLSSGIHSDYNTELPQVASIDFDIAAVFAAYLSKFPGKKPSVSSKDGVDGFLRYLFDQGYLVDPIGGTVAFHVGDYNLGDSYLGIH